MLSAFRELVQLYPKTIQIKPAQKMTISRNLLLKLSATFFGAALGYIYWYFIGCLDGCSIQSVWWRMSLWGAVMAYLLASIGIDFLKNKKEKA